MADLFDTEQPRRLGPSVASSAFRRCDTCGGLGFLRRGEFADRTYPRCPTCHGLGQAYLQTAPPPPSE